MPDAHADNIGDCVVAASREYTWLYSEIAGTRPLAVGRRRHSEEECEAEGRNVIHDVSESPRSGRPCWSR